MTLLAAYLVLLSRYSGQDDIAVGSPVASEVMAAVIMFSRVARPRLFARRLGATSVMRTW